MLDVELLDTLGLSALPAVLDRRSVHLLLEELWHVDRSGFWKRILGLMRDGTPGLSRAVGAQSVVKLARFADDLAPLLSALADDASTDQARRAIRFLSGFVASDPAAIEPGVWLSWARTGAISTDGVVRSGLAGMVHQILRIRRADLDRAAQRDAAAFARTLLSTALERNTPLYSMRFVLDTISFDAAENLASLRALVAPGCQHAGKDEALDDLSRAVNELLGDPELVGALYERAIRLEADDEARERLESLRWYDEARAAESQGRDVPRAPTHALRDHDIDGLLHEHAAKFINRAPLVAARAIVQGLRYYDTVTKRSVSGSITLKLGSKSFVVPKRQPGRALHSMDLLERLRDDLVNALGTVADGVQQQLLDLFVSTPAPESLWSAIIEAATHEPRLREIALELIGTPESLRFFLYATANLIAGLGSDLPEKAHTQILATAAQLVGDDDKHARMLIESALAPGGYSPGPTKGRAADRLDPDDIDDDVVAIEGPADGQDVFDMSRFKLTPEDLRTPANARLRAARRAMRVEEQLIETALHNKKSPSEGVATDAALAAIAELRAALDDMDAHPAILVVGWCTLSRAASLVALSGDDRSSTHIFESSARNDSLPWNGDGSFTDLLNAGQVIVRAEAVRGLVALASRGDARALSDIQRLAKDVEPSVRFQVAWRLRELAELDLTGVWPMLERLIDDSSIGVVEAAVRQLRAFFAKERERALRLAEGALDRLKGVSEIELGARTDLMLQLSWYQLARGEEVSTRAMDRVLLDLPRTTAGLGRLLHSYRSWLTMGVEEEEPEAAARKRTIHFFKRVASGAIAGMRAEAERDPNARQRTERGQHAQLLEHLAYQLFFASGAFRRKDGEEELSLDVMVRFYGDVKDLLLEIGLSGSNSSSDKILNTLEHFFRVSKETDRIASREVLNAFVDVTEAMIREGAADSVWMLDSVENVLRRCVAERDASIYDETMLRSWGTILDPLLDRGWPQAYRLARDLDVSR